MELIKIDLTGCRLVGAITKELGHAGPKHHALVLGKHPLSDEIYIIENMSSQYQVTTVRDFVTRYAQNGKIIVLPNEGRFENVDVAKRAISEINSSRKLRYNLINNNCESFVNRAMLDKSNSTQVINTLLGMIFLPVVGYILKNAK
ncbi:lecithin retinol acyltransferase family protein [Glaciecola sp. 2405UD65-10]|uniref:lecithin retinol acyltransferase family protein n=1 Tax=Glaciecola sp. 2405UD65-10 TaxID=3397244 RepID=UPI003B5CC281